MLPDSTATDATPQRRVRLDPALSVNDVLLRHPETMAVFNAFGVDACCGGAAALPDAARTAGLEPATLLDALESVIHYAGEEAR